MPRAKYGLAHAILATGCAFVASSVSGQTVRSEEELPRPAARGLEEIVVTARKREENLQDVPVAVTALSGEEVARQSVATIVDVGRLAPNMKIAEAGGNAGAPILSMRGQVQTDIVGTLDSSVGIYVDGVYWGRPIGANASLLDVQSVEVLRGPQGTLFGRNTTGGALNFRTQNPDPSGYGGEVSATVGNFDELDGSAVLNVPLVEDKLALRVALSRNSNEGYGDNTLTGKGLAERDDRTIRTKLLFNATEDLSVLLSYDDFKLDQAGAVQKLFGVVPFSPADIVILLSSGGCLRAILPSCPAAFVPGQDSPANYIGGSPYASALDFDSQNKARAQTSSATVTYDISSSTVLKTVLAYREVSSQANIDLDGTPYTILGTVTKGDFEQISVEPQLTGRLLNVDYVAGLFYFNEKGEDFSRSLALPLLNPNITITDGEVENNSYAAYVQGNYALTDRLNFTGGLRYSKDEKELESHNRVTRPAGVLCAVPGASADCSRDFTTESSDVDFLASFDYRFSSSVLGYAKLSKGYRAGGLNLRGSGSIETFADFEPETVLSYEVGLKSDLYDRRIRLNAALFYSDYEDIQRSILIGTSTGGVATAVQNAAEGAVHGAELEIQALATERLRLAASLGYTHAEYDQYQSGTTDKSDEPFPFTPEWSGSISADYTVPLGFGSLNGRADYSFQSESVVASAGINASVLPIQTQGDYGLLNARLTATIDKLGLEIAAFARNLLDKEYKVSTVELITAGIGLVEGQYGPPRQYGVQATWRFGNE